MIVEPQTESAPRAKALPIWPWPILTFASAVSYFLVFAPFPIFRDVPWLNLPLTWVGAAGSACAVASTWRQRHARSRKTLSVVGLAASGAIAALFSLYIFYISYQMPAPGQTARTLSQTPDLTLFDQNNRPVALSDFRGKKLAILFYRGHW